MRTKWRLSIAFSMVSGLTGLLLADDASKAPRPVPLTRPEMKQYLEDMKQRTPRFPLPELTDADREALGERADSYESRLRYHYLGQSNDRRAANRTTGQRSGPRVLGGREQDPNMTLDYKFKTQLFWIVSRANNCQY